MSSRAAVLVIDDEPGMRDMLAWELSQEGFEVTTVESGMAAVEAVKTHRFDLAITDLKMPGMDGIATVEALRRLAPDIEVIVATGYATIETAVACMKHGAFDYVQKPYDLTELKLLLERAMQKSHLQGVVALYEASRVLLSTLKHSELVEIVLDLAQRVLGAEDVGLLLCKGASHECVLHCTQTDAPPPKELFEELAQTATANQGALLVSSFETAPFSQWQGSGYSSALAYPLQGKARCLGSLSLLRRHGTPGFAPLELQRGNIFANLLALSLDNARLYEDLEERVRELVATRDQLLQAEKLALAGHLAGAVAHEVNNPLMVVRANLNALRDYSSTVGALWLAAKTAALYLRDHPAQEAAEAARRLHVVCEDEERTNGVVREIAEVIDDTLDGVKRIAELVAGFTRLATPADPAPPERLFLRPLLEECLVLVPYRSERQGRAMELEAEDGCEIVACREDLRAALLNVLAFLCSPGRRGESATGALRVRLSQEARGPTIVIADDALVLSAEDRARLFDPRVEVDTLSGRTMRLNIGLALAHHMLSRNGAEISVAATPAGGTELRIFLPPDRRR